MNRRVRHTIFALAATLISYAMMRFCTISTTEGAKVWFGLASFGWFVGAGALWVTVMCEWWDR